MAEACDGPPGNDVLAALQAQLKQQQQEVAEHQLELLRLNQQLQRRLVALAVRTANLCLHFRIKTSRPRTRRSDVLHVINTS